MTEPSRTQRVGDAEARGASFAHEIYMAGERDGTWSERARVIAALHKWAEETKDIALRMDRLEMASRFEDEEHLHG